MKKCILPVLSSIFTVSTFGFFGSLQYAQMLSNGWMISTGFAIAAGIFCFFTIRMINKNMIRFSENQSSELKEVQHSLQTLDQNCRTALASHEQQVQSAIEENRCANAHFIKESKGILDEVKAQLDSLNHEVSSKLNTMNTSYMQAVDEMQKSIRALVSVSLEAFIKASTETSKSMNNETNALLERKIQVIVDLLSQQGTQLETHEKNISTIAEKTNSKIIDAVDLQNKNMTNALAKLCAHIEQQADNIAQSCAKQEEQTENIKEAINDGERSLRKSLERILDTKLDTMVEMQKMHEAQMLEMNGKIKDVTDTYNTTLHQINQNSHKLEELTKEDIVLLKRIMGAK